MTRPIPFVVYVHLAAAIVAMLLGSWQLLRPKGTGPHRIVGRVFVAVMLTVAITSLWIPSFLQFTWIHLFTLLTLISLPVAIWRIRHGDVKGHAGAMKGLFIGGLVIAGAFALTPGRLLGNLLWKGVWGYM